MNISEVDAGPESRRMNRSLITPRRLFAALVLTLSISSAAAQESYSPYVNQPYPTNLYWGDPHCMLFNQRPVVDHFAWAKEVAHLDF